MSGSNTGGAEKFFERMSVSLNNQENLNLKVIIKKNPKRFNFLKKEKIDVDQLNFFNKFDIFSKYKLAKICIKFNPNIIITWMNRASLMLFEKKYSNEIRIGRLGGFYKLKNYIHCDYLIANTEEIKNYIILKGWDKKKVFYLPNFVEENNYSKIKKKNENKKVILAVGRFHENKDFETIIKSLFFLKNYELWLVGEGHLKKNYFYIAKKYNVKNRLKIFNWTDEMSRYYNLADIFVCSSIIEPLGNVILEAWSHRIPVITSNVMGPAKLVSHKVNGLKFQKKNVKNLVECVETLEMNNVLKKKIIKNGFNNFKKNYSEKVVIKKYLDFFHKVMK